MDQNQVIMKGIILKKAFIFVIIVITFVGCQRHEKSIIVGKWEVCGSTIHEGLEPIPICGCENGGTYLFTVNGKFKARNSCFNNNDYRLEGDTILYIVHPFGLEDFRFPVEFLNKNSNMIIYGWTGGGLGLSVQDVCLKKVK